MKYIKTKLLVLFALILWGCSSDDFSTSNIDNAAAPSEISALFTITQDNTGKVTIRPNGNGVTSFKVFFGDGTETAAELNPGGNVVHTYAEGVYNVRVVGVGINGLETESIETLTVSFREPENFVVSATTANTNPFQVNVTAEALFAAFFEVTFGEDPALAPVQFNPGETVSYVYQNIGTYTVTVTAYSGGAASVQTTVEHSVFNPLLLPIDFESSTLNYTFGDFGGAFGSVIDNPDVSAENMSARVGQFVKTTGSEVWGGTLLTLDTPIDFSAQDKISMKVWSPAAGIPVMMKIENISDGNIFVEVFQNTTVANAWETITYDFSAQNPADTYQKVVVFFNFGTSGTDESYYFDDIMLTDGEPEIVVPLDFENTNLTYEFSNFGGATSQVIDNPDASGINTSSRVGNLFKQNGSETWAGSFINLDAPIDFSVMQKIKMKVWSPTAGIQVLLKLENAADGNIFVEVPVTNTVAGAWEELTFDLTGVNNANNYQRIVVFFDFNVNGTDADYYFDDIQLSN
uniref:hypothetical protein n=1 Tax=Flavobacterium sp. TaxID=239 RepID=UPI00404A7C01